eukprot:TRINITY_DN35518_c0_g1_i1.p1 TRINITY_DN35518_c0_g1~~TRINITY_DN35518_c0_g1_i1.p1  ORF type:complete len:202 (+),score=32.07 TRINITY_DN35518_c0_g1_i1:37-606(+)
MSWRAFCSQAVPNGAKFLYHPSEAHSHGVTKWLKNNFHDVVQLNPGWTFKVREALTNNPHITMTYAQGHTRSIALYNATEEEVEKAMKTLVEYGSNAPKGSQSHFTHEPSVVSYSPATFGFGNIIKSHVVGRRDTDRRIGGVAPTDKETFNRPGRARPQRFGALNRGRGDDTFTRARGDSTLPTPAPTM